MDADSVGSLSIKPLRLITGPKLGMSPMVGSPRSKSGTMKSGKSMSGKSNASVGQLSTRLLRPDKSIFGADQLKSSISNNEKLGNAGSSGSLNCAKSALSWMPSQPLYSFLRSGSVQSSLSKTLPRPRPKSKLGSAGAAGKSIPANCRSSASQPLMSARRPAMSKLGRPMSKLAKSGSVGKVTLGNWALSPSQLASSLPMAGNDSLGRLTSRSGSAR